MTVRDLVEIKQGLVDGPLQLLGINHALQSSAPVILGWFQDRFKADNPTTGVHERHELLSVLHLLHGRLLEELGTTRQRYIMPLIVVGL